MSSKLPHFLSISCSVVMQSNAGIKNKCNSQIFIAVPFEFMTYIYDSIASICIHFNIHNSIEILYLTPGFLNGTQKDIILLTIIYIKCECRRGHWTQKMLFFQCNWMQCRRRHSNRMHNLSKKIECRRQHCTQLANCSKLYQAF